MKKKYAYTLLAGGIGCILASLPFFIGLIYDGRVFSHPKARYEAGLARLGGWFAGSDQDRLLAHQNHYERAIRIDRGRVLVSFPVASDEEADALFEHLWSFPKYRDGGVTVDKDLSREIVTFEVQGENEASIRADLAAFQVTSKNAQQVGAGQPATAPESKPEDKEQPIPETKPAPR